MKKTFKESFSPSISVSINSSQHFRSFRILFHGVEFSKQFEGSKNAIKTLRCSWMLIGKGSQSLLPRACAVADELKLSKRATM